MRYRVVIGDGVVECDSVEDARALVCGNAVAGPPPCRDQASPAMKKARRPRKQAAAAAKSSAGVAAKDETDAPASSGDRQGPRRSWELARAYATHYGITPVEARKVIGRDPAAKVEAEALAAAS